MQSPKQLVRNTPNIFLMITLPKVKLRRMIIPMEARHKKLNSNALAILKTPMRNWWIHFFYYVVRMQYGCIL